MPKTTRLGGASYEADAEKVAEPEKVEPKPGKGAKTGSKPAEGRRPVRTGEPAEG